jgi:hypothetical protein
MEVGGMTLSEYDNSSSSGKIGGCSTAPLLRIMFGGATIEPN